MKITRLGIWSTVRRLVSLLLSLTIVANLGTGQDVITNDICRNINSGNYTLNIRGAFIFSERLIFISNDWLVYELPSSTIDNNFGRLFMNVTSHPIEKHWPAFGRSARFRAIKSRIANIFSMQHHKHQYLYFDVYHHHGLVYDIENERLSTGSIYDFYDHYRDQAISSLDQLHSLKTKSSEEDRRDLPLFSDWKLSFVDDTPAIVGGIVRQTTLFYVVPAHDHKNLERIAMAYTSDPESPTDGYDIIPITDWGYPPPCGYIHNGYYHLFVRDKVLIFADRILDRFTLGGQPMFRLYQRLTIIEARNFFVCAQAPHLRNVTYPPIITDFHEYDKTLNYTFGTIDHQINFLSTEKELDTTKWIIGGVLIGGILLCCLACAITVFIKQRSSGADGKSSSHRRHRHKDNGSSHRHHSTSKRDLHHSTHQQQRHKHDLSDNNRKQSNASKIPIIAPTKRSVNL